MSLPPNELVVTGIDPTRVPASPRTPLTAPPVKRGNVPLDTVGNREVPSPRLTARQEGVMKRFDAFLDGLNNAT